MASWLRSGSIGAFAFCLAGLLSTPTEALASTRAATTANGEPAAVMGVYYEAYKWGPTKITDVPMDFNVIFLFTASPDGPTVNGSHNNAGDGTFAFKEGYMRRYGHPNMLPSQGNPAVTPALIQKVRARGQKVVLTVGGANNGFNFNTRAKSQNFVNSFVAMNAYFLREGGSPTAGRGLDGVDFNNFESGVGSSSAEMVWIAQQLKALYGPSFMITAPPSGATDYGWIDTNIGRALNAAGLLSFFSPQIYDDSARYSTAEKIAFEINRWISAAPAGYVAAANPPNQYGVGDASKIVIGLPAPKYSPNASGFAITRAAAAYDLVKAKHPKLRGVFTWNFHDTQNTNRAFETTFVPRVFGGAAPVLAPAPATSLTPAPAPAPAPAVAPPPATIAVSTSCATEAWVGSRRYLPGDKVSRLGTSYIALPISATSWNVNSTPEWTPNYWGVIQCGGTTAAPAPAPGPTTTATSCAAAEWVGSRRYMPGERVKRFGLSYVALPISANVWNVNSAPEHTRTLWGIASC